MVRNGEDKKELWYKIRIPRALVIPLILLFLTTVTVLFLIYFDKIGIIIEMRVNKLEQAVSGLIAQATDSGATPKEIDDFNNRFSALQTTRDEVGVLAYRADLMKFSDEIQMHIEKLKEYQKGYIARISKVIEQVSVNIKDTLSWKRANKNEQLKSGDKVKTGTDSSAVITTDSGSVIRVNAESMIIMKDLSIDRQTWKRREVYSIRESDNADYHFKTDTTNITLEDENASFNVSEKTEVRLKKKERDTTLSVYVGRVEVTNNQGEKKEVKSHEALNINLQGNFMETIRIPYPPTLVEPPNLQFYRFSESDEGNVTLTWLKHEQINNYQLQVAFDVDFNRKLVDKEINGLSYRLTKLDRGNYFWRVASIDTEKTEIRSEFSARRSFLVTFSQGDENTDITPPVFITLSVKKVSHEAVTIEGKTEPGARLVVEGISVNVKEDGSFSDIVPLELRGKQTLELKLYDKAGNINRKNVSLYP